MDQSTRSPDPANAIISEPRTGASIPLSESGEGRSTTTLDLIGACAAAGFVIMPLLAGAVFGG